MSRRAWKGVLGLFAALIVILALTLGGKLWSAHARATAILQHQEGDVASRMSSMRCRSTEC